MKMSKTKCSLPRPYITPDLIFDILVEFSKINAIGFLFWLHLTTVLQTVAHIAYKKGGPLC